MATSTEYNNDQSNLRNHSQSFKLTSIYLDKVAGSKRIFTFLGPLLVRSQSDDFSAVAGSLVADITIRGIKNTFEKKRQHTVNE